MTDKKAKTWTSMGSSDTGVYDPGLSDFLSFPLDGGIRLTERELSNF